MWLRLTSYKNLKHGNILELIDFELGSNEYTLMLEMLSGGSLRNYLDQYGPFEEEIIRAYIFQVMVGI